MTEKGIPVTGCYEELTTSREYQRIGAGWVISQASAPRDRRGSIVLQDGVVYHYDEEDCRRAAGSITERPFVVALTDHTGAVVPADAINYGDETGAQQLLFAAQDLRAI